MYRIWNLFSCWWTFRFILLSFLSLWTTLPWTFACVICYPCVRISMEYKSNSGIYHPSRQMFDLKLFSKEINLLGFTPSHILLTFGIVGILNFCWFSRYEIVIMITVKPLVISFLATRASSPVKFLLLSLVHFPIGLCLLKLEIKTKPTFYCILGINFLLHMWQISSPKLWLISFF